MSITVDGFTAGALVTLTASTKDVDGHLWRSHAVFRADDRGRVAVADEAPVSGTYGGRDPMGLFWSMREIGATVPPERQLLFTPIVSTVTIEAATAGRSAASATLTRRWRRDVSLQKTTKARDGFPGCFWKPRTTSTRAPAVLTLGGSTGGLPCGTGLLASHSYPELNLAYFGVPGTPPYLERIPIEYFSRALRWLARQPGVDPRHLVVWGVSRGAEAAILTAATYPSLAHAVVEWVGSNTAGPSYGNPGGNASPAWTIGGRQVPIGSILPAWKVNGPLFMVGAENDVIVNSGNTLKALVQELEQHGRRDFTALSYPNAGHAIATQVPNLPVGNVVLDYGVPAPLGGTLAGDAHARADAWAKVLQFLARLAGSH